MSPKLESRATPRSAFISRSVSCLIAEEFEEFGAPCEMRLLRLNAFRLAVGANITISRSGFSADPLST